MDKRTILFVVSLSLTLFLVNTFFQYQNRDRQEAWARQQAAKKRVQIEKLETLVSKDKEQKEPLPLIFFYADQAKSQLLTTAILSKRGTLSLAWDKQLPQKVFAEIEGKLTPLVLVEDPKRVNAPVIYTKETEEPLLEAEQLPEFGKFQLKIVPISAGKTTTTATIGIYDDGHLMIPRQKLNKLYRELGKKENLRPNPLTSDGIALLKTPDSFLPVALYNSEQNFLIPFDELPQITDLISYPQREEQIDKLKLQEERFYVLENAYLQLVFSNRGGALAEINLPFKSKVNSKSAVKEIAFDREMVDEHPYNAYFPIHSYSTPAKTAGAAVVTHSKGTLGNYYPLIRRDLIKGKAQKSVKINPEFYALNTVSEYPELANLVYEVKQFNKETIVFEATQRHRKITKTFSLKETDEAPYTFDFSIQIDGDNRGLWLTSGVPEVEWISGGLAPTLKYRITRNNKSEVETLSLPKDALNISSVSPDWISNSNGFFGIILNPITTVDPGLRAQFVPGITAPSRLVEIEGFSVDKLPGYQMMIPLLSGNELMQFRIFAGPLSKNILTAVDEIHTDPETGVSPDYISTRISHGWFSFISEPFAKFLFFLMNLFYQLTASWGLSIILLTVALRFMLYPLNAWSTKSMLRSQEIQPEIAAIQKKYKKEPQKMQLEQMNLYRERGVNPISGCFPLLIQMPFLFGMFNLLKSSFDLRGASFIPGWIDNLAAPDVLFTWTTPIFFIGNEFHLLPFLLGGLTLLQQKMMSKGQAKTKEITESQKQQRMMGNIMPMVLILISYNFPSGLNLYWISSTLMGMLQQWWTAKTLKTTPVVLPAQAKQTKGKKKKKQ